MKRLAKYVIRWLYEHLFCVPYMWMFCKKYFKKNEIYVLVCPHIGDFIFALGYLNEQFAHEKIINVICVEKYEEIYSHWANERIKFIGLSDKKLFRLLSSNRNPFGQRLNANRKNVFFVEPETLFMHHYEDVKYYPDITFRKTIKYGCLHLDEGADYCNPICDDNREPTKKILIVTESETIDLKSKSELYNNIASKLVNKGYSVVFNQKDSVEGYESVYPTFAEVLKETGRYDAVIGVRSGIEDLYALNGKVKVIAIYPSDYDNKLMSFYSIKDSNRKNEHLYDYVLSDSNQTDVDNIIDLV